MVGLPAARITDLHVCPLCVVPLPIMPPGAVTVIIGGLPAARITDKCVCVPPPPAPPIPPPFDLIIMGSPTVHIMGLPAARMTDPTTKGGLILPPCCPTVLIGPIGVVPPAAPAIAFPNVWEEVLADGTTVTHVGDNITIVGDKPFRDRVVADLQKLDGTATGHQLLQNLDTGPKHVTIERTAGGNECGNYPNAAGRFVNADGTPGAGTDSTVSYNPDRTEIGDGTEAWTNRPPEVGLGHELVHADDAANGRMDTGDDAGSGTRNRELQAVGLPPYADKSPSENGIRRDMGLPERPRY